MYHKIAVATDGSAMGGKAVLEAARLATLCGSELIILHVLMHGEPPDALVRMAEVEHLVDEHPQIGSALASLPGQTLPEGPDHKRVDHQVITVMGDAVTARAVTVAKAAGVKKVSSEILDGDTTDQIIGAASRHGADLIAVGTRGLGPLKGLLMGSVSQKISQHADCACLIIK